MCYVISSREGTAAAGPRDAVPRAGWMAIDRIGLWACTCAPSGVFVLSKSYSHYGSSPLGDSLRTSLSYSRIAASCYCMPTRDWFMWGQARVLNSWLVGLVASRQRSGLNPETTQNVGFFWVTLSKIRITYLGIYLPGITKMKFGH